LTGKQQRINRTARAVRERYHLDDPGEIAVSEGAENFLEDLPQTDTHGA
jgi:hypothetical protein